MKFILLIVAAVALLTSSCGPSNGLKAANSLSANKDNSRDNIENPNIPVFNVGELSGEVSGGPIDKASVIVYDVSEHAIQIRIPMTGLTGQGEAEIPNVPGSRVFVDNSDPNLPTLVVSVPGLYVLGKMGFNPGEVGLDPKHLPNGEALPFTPGGEPPEVSFLIPNIDRKVQVYLGINVVAVFIPTAFDPRVDLTFPIRNSSKIETIGYFSTVRRRQPHSGGFFVSLNMPRRIAGALDDYLRKVVVP